MNAANPSTIALLVFIPLIAWRIYRRFRRLVGRQRLSKVRLWIRLLIYPVLLLLLGAAMHGYPERICWLAGALGLGALLGAFGLKKTDFEPTSTGLFYTPHAHLGIALSLLFVARIAYRLFEIYASPAPPQGHSMDHFGQNPLTLIVFGLLAGYNITYTIGLLRWRSRTLPPGQRGEALDLKLAGAPHPKTLSSCEPSRGLEQTKRVETAGGGPGKGRDPKSATRD